MNAISTETLGPTALPADRADRQSRTPGLIPRQWCEVCARQTWVVTFEETEEIVDMSPSGYGAKAGKAIVMRSVHTVTTRTGTTLICLKSLFQCIFSICDAEPRKR
jgi:hypothetical protein